MSDADTHSYPVTSGPCGAKAYVERAIASYAGDPADNQFQKGFLAALEVVRDEAFDGCGAPAQAETDPLKHPEYIIEGIILRRLHEKRIEGYTLEMCKEIAAALSLPSTARAILPGHDETMANLDALTIKSTDPRCTCAAIVNPNIPHARTCPLFSTNCGGGK
jgi:hypothetical protein